MNVTKAFRMLILAISLSMFLWQAYVAISKLMDPPVVDSTERLNMADIEPLLITICPLEQWNKTMIKQYGYGHLKDLLRGYQDSTIENDFEPIFVGWGAKQNLTYGELIQKVLNFNLSNPKMFVYRDKKPNAIDFSYEIRFYPKHGYCYDLVNLIGEVLTVNYYPKVGKAQVYITDKKLRTGNTLFAKSHWGSKIVLQKNWVHEFVVKVEQLSNFDPRKPDECKEYANDEYEKCVDDELQKIWKPLINCNPPWLSSMEKCDDGVMNISEKTSASVYKNSFKTVSGIFDMKTYPAIEQCAKSCTVTKANVFKGEKSVGLLDRCVLEFNFDDQVVFTTKQLAYGPSDFLIDIGSSLGLWFGLSVFGISDLGILAFQWVKHTGQEVMKKIILKVNLIYK